jgi:DNA-binding NarL/FixJ family response regulator
MAAKKKIEKSDDGKTKVLIVDDHSVVVEGIKAALKDQQEFEVVGTASDGLEAINQVKSLKPDIVIMDISMPNLNGIEAAHDIHKVNKNIRIVIFSMHSDKEYVLSLFRAGILGYVLKEESIEDLILALKSVKVGGTYFSKSIQEVIQEHMYDLELSDRETTREVADGLIRLSAREKEVFPLLADGLSIKEISKRLSISPKTVESHKYNIMEKLNVTSVADLTKIALRKNLIKL